MCAAACQACGLQIPALLAGCKARCGAQCWHGLHRAARAMAAGPQAAGTLQCAHPSAPSRLVARTVLFRKTNFSSHFNFASRTVVQSPGLFQVVCTAIQGVGVVRLPVQRLAQPLLHLVHLRT